jgi:hypothetical protein
MKKGCFFFFFVFFWFLFGRSRLDHDSPAIESIVECNLPLEQTRDHRIVDQASTISHMRDVRVIDPLTLEQSNWSCTESALIVGRHDHIVNANSLVESEHFLLCLK